MRASLLILLLALTFAVQGQSNYSIESKGESLSAVIKQLSKTYGIKFSYSPRLMAKHTLAENIKANSQEQLISKVFENLPFDLKLRDGIYLIVPTKEKPKPVAIRGQIYDNDSGEPLAFAHIQTKESGALSTQNGQFTLPPTKDTLTLKVSYIGYENLEIKVPPLQSNLKLRLNQNPQELKEVILTAESERFNPDPSFFSLNPQQFSSLPMLGETDVFKTLQLLPGVRATDETSSGLIVRGSVPSQNLVLMDGFTLYNLDHFFGVFSTLNPNAINNVSIYKGGFGPKYGGRVSSVIDVAGRNGQSDKFSGSVGLNMLSFNTTLTTPIGRKTSALFAFRQSFTDIINSNLYQDFLTSNRQNYLESINSELTELSISPSLRFHDINGKVQHRFNDRYVMDVNFYLSEDFYEGNFQEGDDFTDYSVGDHSNWANAGLSFNLKSYFKPNWFNTTTIGISEYSEDESLVIEQTFFEDVTFAGDSIEAFSTVEYFDYTTKSSVGDVTLKTHNEFELNGQSSIAAGLEINSINTNYETTQSFLVDFANTDSYTDTLNVEADITSLYGNYQYRKDDITTNIGLRASYYGPTEKWYLEPRFDIGVKVNDRFSLKGAGTFHHQYITETSLSILQNADQFYWVLADDDILPVQKSTHFIFGGYYNFKNWSIDLEYYNKRTEGIIESQFIALPPALLEELLEDDLNLAGTNNAEGIDLFVKYRNKTFTSWLSYSLGRSENAFWYRNQNTPYPSIQDQRHELNFTNILKLGKWELSSVLLFGSGQPYTPANPEFSIENDSVSFYDLERINQERLPSYKRLDLSAKYSFNIGKLACETGVTLFNVLNNRNIKSRKFTVRYFFDEATEFTTDEDRVEVVPLDTELLGFTPNFFLKISF